MFIRALITMLAADAVDRHMREQQHRAWLAEYEARAAAATRPAVSPSATPAYDPARPERPTSRPPASAAQFLGARFAARPSWGRWQQNPHSTRPARWPSSRRARTSSPGPDADADRGERPGRQASSPPPAACAPPDAAAARRRAERATGGRRLIGWPTRAIAVAGVLAAIAALNALRPADATPVTFAAAPRRTARRRAHLGSRPTPGQAEARPRSRSARIAPARSAAPKRSAHRQRTPAAPPPPVVAAPRPRPSSPERFVPPPAPHQTAPLPKRVPAGAPPEFM